MGKKYDIYMNSLEKSGLENVAKLMAISASPAIFDKRMIFLDKCPICKSERIMKWGKKCLVQRETPLDLADAEDQFLLSRLNKTNLVRSIYYCRSCTFLFQNPTYTEDELQNIYKSEGINTLHYYKAVGKSSEQLWDSPIAHQNIEKRKAFYASMILSLGGSIILDYGGGSGINLTHPSLNKKERYVYDFGKDEHYYAKGISPIMLLDDDNRFDFILCTHVLEHETDPLSTFQKLRKVIKPHGHLFLEIPFDFSERIISRRPGAIWHINYFNRKSIIEIAKRSGWLCQWIRLNYMPYTKDHLLCIAAFFKPELKSTIKRQSVTRIQVIYDMIKCLSKRLRDSFLSSIN